MEQIAKQPFGPREHLSTLFRHKGKILAVFFATVLVAGPGSFLLTEIYKVQARILVQHSRSTLPIGAILSPPSSPPSSYVPKDEVNTEVEIFRSPFLVDRLVEDLGAERVLKAMRHRWDWVFELPNRLMGPYVRRLLASLGIKLKQTTPHEAAVEEITEYLKVKPVRQVDVFTASFKAPDPVFAALVVNTLVELYLDHHLALRQMDGGEEFFAEESARLRKQLQAAEDRLQAYKERWGIMLIENQKEELLKRVSKVEADLKRAQVDAVEVERLIAEIQRQLGEQSEAIPLTSVKKENPILGKLQERLVQLELDQSQYVPESPAAMDIQREIAAIRGRMAAEKTEVTGPLTSGVNKNYQELQKTLALTKVQREALRARLTELAKQVEAYRQSLARLDEREQQFQELSRNALIKAEAYALYLRKHEEARVNRALDTKKISNVSPIEAAVVPWKPVWPKKKWFLILGIVVGLIGGVGVAYVCEYFRRTFATKEEIKQVLGRPVWAALPLAQRNPGPTAQGVIQLMHIEQALYQANKQQRVHSLLVTSTEVGEGKSYVATALARSLSREGYRILSVDASSLLHLLHQDPLTLGQSGAGGQSTAEAPSPGEPQPTGYPNLYTLIGTKENRTHFGRLRQIVDETQRLRDGFDLVVIEGPALGPYPEGLSLASAVDGVLVVVEAERTKRTSVKETVQILDDAGGHILGLVLNKRQYAIPAWIYNGLLTDGRTNSRA